MTKFIALPDGGPPVDIPGFRRVMFWEDPHELVTGFATNELSRDDEEKLAVNPATGSFRAQAHPLEGMYAFATPGISLHVLVPAALGLILGLFVAQQADVHGGLAALVAFLVAACGAAAGAFVLRRVREGTEERRTAYTALLGRTQHAVLRADDEMVSLALETTMQARSVRGNLRRWPDLVAAVPDVPALASEALTVHLAAEANEDVLAERVELWRAEGLLEGTSEDDDDAELALVRAKGRDLAERECERARQVEMAGARLMEAQTRIRQIKSSARARASLAEGEREAAGQARG